MKCSTWVDCSLTHKLAVKTSDEHSNLFVRQREKKVLQHWHVVAMFETFLTSCKNKLECFLLKLFTIALYFCIRLGTYKVGHFEVLHWGRLQPYSQIGCKD